MAHRELTERLNQHGQQAGPLVGCAMGLALLVCMVTAMVLYQRIGEFNEDIYGIPTVVQSVPTIPPTGTVRITRGTPTAGRPTAEASPRAAEGTGTPSAAVKYKVVKTGGENLNLRASPSATAAVVTRVAPNSTVEDAGEQQGSWRKVRAPGGQVGWVDDQYLEKVTG